MSTKQVKLFKDIKEFRKKFPRQYLEILSRGQVKSHIYPLLEESRSSVLNNKKKAIIEIAKKQQEKPIPGKHPLGHALKSYINESSDMYDPVFRKKIKQIRPEWFITKKDQANQKKLTLLEMAKTGVAKPGVKHELYYALHEYTSKNSRCFDELFTKKLSMVRPDWLVNQKDLCSKIKAKLLQMAKNGDKRPVRKKHELAERLACYTSKNHTSFDELFFQELKKIRPDWFRR